MKFKGKGHEVWRPKEVKRHRLTSYDLQYSDVARLLNVYQLWLDDLYPRAKFADGLAIIEKLGHTKRMQTMRREWINERKPRESLHGLVEDTEKLAGEKTTSKSGQDQSWKVKLGERPQTLVAVVGDESDDDDPYTATPKPTRDDGSTKRDGDMENLFLEGPTKTVSIPGQEPGSPTREEDIDDYEDALLALNDVW